MKRTALFSLLVAGVTACGDGGARERGRDALDSAAAFARDSVAADTTDGAVQTGPLIDSTGVGSSDTGGNTTDPDGAPPVPPTTTSEWTTGIAARAGQSGVATLRAVRAGRQEGFDRIVFEFDGDTAPGYHVSYIDRPVRTCGSGEVVPLPGDGWLEIRMQPSQAHTEAGQPTITSRTRALELPNLKRITMTCDFEADVTWVGGVLSPNEFRVLALTGPTRLVVDIRHR
ncbi:MAG TPA: hypothetical protein VF035_08605 [Longimicrobiales bacterium]